MKCLIVDKMHPGIIKDLERIGFEVDYNPEFTRARIKSLLPGYDGLLIRSKTRVDEDLLSAASKLKFVGRAGAGLDNFDVDYLNSRNIIVINAPEGNKDALAEHAIGMLLALLNHLHKADREVRNYQWLRESNRGTELGNKTVAIIGYGNMGQAFAERLHAFGCRILAYDKYRDQVRDSFVKRSSMEEIYRNTDIISFHVPLTKETESYYNLDFFNRFDKPLYLINTSRGEILPLKDLWTLIESNKIKGAALDVLENERISSLEGELSEIFDKLIQSEKVILSPHVAGWSHESYQRINQILIDKIKLLVLSSL